ncbi:hypothetical protein H7I94_00070, partial [Mycobacterium szulgai]|nr:hypothetical protein [Mycobacterium szulgai]
MTIFDRFNFKVIAAGAGLCGAAISLSPVAGATPLITGGGYACMQGMSGEGAPAAGAPAAGGGGAGAAGGPAMCCAYGGAGGGGGAGT